MSFRVLSWSPLRGGAVPAVRGRKQLVQLSLGHRLAVDGLFVAAKGVQGLLEPLIGEGLDQVVHHAHL